MNDMLPEIEIFRNFIRSRGLRQTPERDNIVVEIFRKREHFDVEELFLRLLARGRKISGLYLSHSAIAGGLRPHQE
jgi:Fur family ferric uptake transcriptional regulator